MSHFFKNLPYEFEDNINSDTDVFHNFHQESCHSSSSHGSSYGYGIRRCRLCRRQEGYGEVFEEILKNSELSGSIFDLSGIHVSLPTAKHPRRSIDFMYSLKVHRFEEIPAIICMRCQAEVQHFAKFRKEIQASDAYYYDSIPKVQIRIVPVEKRPGVDRIVWYNEDPELQCKDVVVSAEKNEERKGEK
jgi:hypothetical protein